MSDDTPSQPEDTVSRVEYASLQEQLKAARMERDRQIFEKSEIVAKANAYAKERDELRAGLASLTAERDRLAGEKAADAAKILESSRQADEFARRAAEAAAEIARLRQVIETAPSTEPLTVLWKLVSDQTKAAVAWVRGKIPAESPVLPWFDKAIEGITKIGCLAVKLSTDLIRWATPRAVDLFQRGKREIEARLAKK